MIKTVIQFLPPLVMGMVLGTVFFGGLWLTVRKLGESRHPAILFTTSAILRTAVVLLGIWFVAAGEAFAMIACLLGFWIVRLISSLVGRGPRHSKSCGSRLTMAEAVATRTQPFDRRHKFGGVDR